MINKSVAIILEAAKGGFKSSDQSNSKPSYDLLRWIFLRGLALIYLAAFASITVQIEGLIGSNGILPIQIQLNTVATYFPDNKFIKFPTLFWLDASDLTLKVVCYAGIVGSALLLLNIFTKTVLVILYFLYLSITVAGQDFTAFQWDSLLLETGFLAILLPWGSKIIIFLYRWLIARFMFMGGVVKLASGDPNWLNLTALNYHYQTQPLPSPLAYYAHYLPQWVNKLSVAGVLFIELVVPFMVFLPHRFRVFAAWSFFILQSGIILTGNYNFFNLLTILLCLFLFDDQDIEKIIPVSLVTRIRASHVRSGPGPVASTVAVFWMGIVLTTCATYIWISAARQMPGEPFKKIIKITSAFSVVNNYGPFAIMTTERPEIIIQGSYDGKQWYSYKFKYKPVDLDHHLVWNIPHQPRLDWQMWFAALSAHRKPLWFDRLMLRLTEGSPQVLSLLAENPFQGRPPTYIRALLFRYYYSTLEQRAASGQIWQRKYLGEY